MKRFASRAGVSSVALLAVVLAAANWPQFRGPDGDGTADVSGLPTTWNATENVLWKVPAPGYGASSPITWGDKIFISGYSGYGTEQAAKAKPGDLVHRLTCLRQSDGSQVWQLKWPVADPDRDYQGFVALHGYASATPATDGQSVFAFFGKAGLYACTLDGKQLWHADCGDGTHNFGSGGSPVLYKNLVIVNACVESRSLIAFDKQSGEEVWRVEGIDRAWNTPAVVPTQAGDELVLSMQKKLVAYDPASGKVLWTCEGIQDYVCPSVITHDGVIYAIGGRGRVGLAVKAGGRGDVTDTHRLYELERGSNVSSPVYHQGHLYWVHESSGIAYCAKADTGEMVYEQRLQPRPGRIYASPLAADGKLYYVSRDKGTFVVAAQPKFELLAHNTLDDGSVFNASPIVSDGGLILRSNEFIYYLKK